MLQHSDTDRKTIRRPRLSFVRTLASAVCVSLIVSTAPVLSEPDPDRLKEIEKALEDHKARELLLREEAARLAAEIMELRKKLVSAAARVQNREAKVTESEDRLEGLVAAEAVLAARLKVRRRDMAETLAALQRLDRNPPPALAVQPDDTVAAMRSALLLSTLVPELEAEAASLRSKIEELRQVRADIISERDTLQSANLNLETERAELEKLVAAKQQAEAQARAKADAEAKEIARLSEEAQTLGELISKLEERAASRIPLSRPDPAQPPLPGQEGETDLASLPPSADPLANDPLFGGSSHLFSEAKGQISLPVQGRIIEKFGENNSIGGKTAGIKLETRAYAQITSPFDGEIAFAGPFRQYGQLLILKVGEGYHLLLAGMAQIDAAVGQRVLAGEPIGLMPKRAAPGANNTPSGRKGAASDRPALYIEFRKEGVPFNPVPWFIPETKSARG